LPIQQNGELFTNAGHWSVSHTWLVNVKQVTGIISVHLHINCRPVAFLQLVYTWQACMANEYHLMT